MSWGEKNQNHGCLERKFDSSEVEVVKSRQFNFTAFKTCPFVK